MSVQCVSSVCQVCPVSVRYYNQLRLIPVNQFSWLVMICWIANMGDQVFIQHLSSVSPVSVKYSSSVCQGLVQCLSDISPVSVRCQSSVCLSTCQDFIPLHIYLMANLLGRQSWSVMMCWMTIMIVDDVLDDNHDWWWCVGWQSWLVMICWMAIMISDDVFVDSHDWWWCIGWQSWLVMCWITIMIGDDVLGDNHDWWWCIGW